MNKLALIKNMILKAGLPCPSEIHVLQRISDKIGNDDDDTVTLVLDRYKRYMLSHRIMNLGTEIKFIAKDNKLMNLDDFVFRRLYNDSFPIPKTPLTEYMFGDRDFFELYDAFLEVDNKIKDSRKKAIVKLNKIKKNEKDSKK